MVQWLRLCSILGWETKVPHAWGCGQKKCYVLVLGCCKIPIVNVQYISTNSHFKSIIPFLVNENFQILKKYRD